MPLSDLFLSCSDKNAFFWNYTSACALYAMDLSTMASPPIMPVVGFGTNAFLAANANTTFNYRMGSTVTCPLPTCSFAP